MVKLASSYDNLLDLNTEIEQAAQQPDQFHTADTHYDVVSKTLPAVDDPSDIKISEVEKTLNQIDQIQKESTKAQLKSNDSQQETANDADNQPEISDNPADALNENQTTTLESVFGNVNNQRSAQSDDGADQSDDQSRDDAMDRIRTQFNHHAKEPTTPVNRDVETLGHGIDQQKVTPINQPEIDRSAGNKSLTAGTQSLSMLNDEDFDRQVDQLTQGIEREAEELAPSQAKVIIDGTDMTDDLPATIAGTYSINRDDNQNITITKTKELPEIPDTSTLEQQVSDLQQELAHSNSCVEQLQADKKQLVLQVQQLQSQIAQAASESAANNDQQVDDDHLQVQNSQTINYQQASTPAAELSTALVKIRQHLSDDATPIEQVEQIDNPSAEFKLISNHALKSSDDRGAVIQQMMGSKPDSEFNQALQSADQIAVQVKTTQADVKPSLGSLSLLALTQARSQINVQFSQKDRKNNARINV